MSNAAALAEIKRLAGLGRIHYTGHALDRMDERGATRGDVRSALLSATSAAWQPDRSTWRVDGGADRDGDALTVIVNLEADVIVVTVF